MIIVVIRNKEQQYVVDDGPFETFKKACEWADDVEQTMPGIECFPVKLCKRNKYGAPKYPFPTDQHGDEDCE